MKRIKLILKMVAFCIVGIVLFGLVQNVLTPDWSTFANGEKILDGLNALEKNSVDVVFLGTSHVEQGMAPMRIYEDTNIVTYSLASSGQRIECSYYLLRKAFQRQSPKVVVLDASNLFSNEETTDHNASWRYIMDNLKLEPLKVEMAFAYGERWYGDGKWSALFPIISYHKRWEELEASDFEKDVDQAYYTAGAFITPMAVPSKLTQKDVDALPTIEDGDAAITISENTLNWLTKMADLCKKNDAHLIITKIPVLASPDTYHAWWSKQRSNAVEKVAEKLGVQFLDLQYHVDLDIDFQMDTSDGGMHLNARGAEKVAKFWGAYFLEHFDLRQQTNQIYEEKLPIYQKVRDIALMQTEGDFQSYLELLAQHKKDWTIIITAREEYTRGMDDETYKLLDNLGLQRIRDGKFVDAYIAVIDLGEVIYEDVSSERIDHTLQTKNINLSLSSSGWSTTAYCSIKVNGTESSTGHRGLNIVVYDNNARQIIDSVAFDTYLEEKTVSRNHDLTVAYFSTFKIKNNAI